MIRNLLMLLGMLLPAALQAQRDTCSCPPPVGDTAGSGRRFPALADMMQRRSPSGRFLGVLVNQGDAGAALVDLETLTRKKITVHGGLPGEIDVSFDDLTWCPYDSDLIALNVASYIDTNHSGVSTVSVSNIFVYRLSTGEAWSITPRSLGSAFLAGDGANGFASLHSAWLPGSRPGLDTFVIRGGPPVFYGLYVPQTQSLVPWTPRSDTSRPRLARAISPNRIDSVWSYDETEYYYDETKVGLPRALDSSTGVSWCSFSPNGRLFALEANPRGVGEWWADTVFPQVWIYHTADLSSPLSVINFQRLYCKYSFWGIWPEFITDSTLAVSMHKDGDEYSPLWEITVDGRIVRQLTFLGGSIVKQRSDRGKASMLQVVPGGGPDRIRVVMQPAIAEATLDLADILGRVLRRQVLTAGAGEAEIDVSGVSAGVYILRIKSEHDVASVKFVVEH